MAREALIAVKFFKDESFFKSHVKVTFPPNWADRFVLLASPLYLAFSEMESK